MNVDPTAVYRFVNRVLGAGPNAGDPDAYATAWAIYRIVSAGQQKREDPRSAVWREVNQQLAIARPSKGSTGFNPRTAGMEERWFMVAVDLAAGKVDKATALKLIATEAQVTERCVRGWLKIMEPRASEIAAVLRNMRLISAD
ncbi:MAG: hypothetical protein KDJ27_13430 [Gammaproteobacteria bacterium]|nr:hypothetical protein [Gammaproteobacteria bacterium]